MLFSNCCANFLELFKGSFAPIRSSALLFSFSRFFMSCTRSFCIWDEFCYVMYWLPTAILFAFWCWLFVFLLGFDDDPRLWLVPTLWDLLLEVDGTTIWLKLWLLVFIFCIYGYYLMLPYVVALGWAVAETWGLLELSNVFSSNEFDCLSNTSCCRSSEFI